MPPPKSNLTYQRIEKLFENENQIAPASQRQSTVEWQQIQIQNFTILRNKISNIREHGVIPLHGTTLNLPDIEQINEWKTFCKSNKPLLHILTSIPLKNLDRILEYLLNWLREYSNDDVTTCKEWITLWIYACLACIFIPVEPNIYSVLREIAKFCRDLRERNIFPSHNMSYSLLICIISTYFRQLDLTDTFN